MVVDTHPRGFPTPDQFVAEVTPVQLHPVQPSPSHEPVSVVPAQLVRQTPDVIGVSSVRLVDGDEAIQEGCYVFVGLRGLEAVDHGVEHQGQGCIDDARSGWQVAEDPSKMLSGAWEDDLRGLRSHTSADEDAGRGGDEEEVHLYIWSLSLYRPFFLATPRGDRGHDRWGDSGGFRIQFKIGVQTTG